MLFFSFQLAALDTTNQLIKKIVFYPLKSRCKEIFNLTTYLSLRKIEVIKVKYFYKYIEQILPFLNNGHFLMTLIEAAILSYLIKFDKVYTHFLKFKL